MFVITNRSIEDGRGVDQFGKKPNAQGPHELRLFEARKLNRKWKIDLIEDKLSDQHKIEVGIPVEEEAFASKYVSRKILQRVRNTNGQLWGLTSLLNK